MPPKTFFITRSVSSLKNSARGFSETAAGRFSFPKKPISEDDFVSQKPASAIDINRLIENNILGLGVTPQVIKSGKHNELAGKVVTFDRPWESETLSPKDVSEDFSVVLSCGLGGGSSVSGLYKSYFAISRLLDIDRVAVYSSLNDAEQRQERFRKAMPYYYDQSHINEEESRNFFDQVLKKKFFNDEGRLKDFRKMSDLVLFGFSVGHRENVSHINFLQREISSALDRESKSPDLIKKYFEKVALVNIGSPVNWSGKRVSQKILKALESGEILPAEITEKDFIVESAGHSMQKKSLQFNIVNFRSVFDMGTAKPESDFNNFHCNSAIFVPEIFKFARPNHKDYMYVLGAGKVREFYFDESEMPKDNALGHELINYARAIFDSEGAKRPILALTSSAKSDISRAEPDVRYFVYDPERKPSDDDKETLREEWSRSLAVRNFLRERGGRNNSR